MGRESGDQRCKDVSYSSGLRCNRQAPVSEPCPAVVGPDIAWWWVSWSKEAAMIDFDALFSCECTQERRPEIAAILSAEARRRVHIQLQPLFEELKSLPSSEGCWSCPTESKPE